MMHRDSSGSEYARLPLRVPKEQLDSVCDVGAYGEDVFYVIENENWFWMGPFVPKLRFVSLATGIVRFRTELPETRQILGVEANSKQKAFAYSCRFEDIQIYIYSTGADYNTVLTHVFRTPMTCGGSGLSAAFASPNVGEYILLWGNISNDSFFHVYTVKTIEDTPVHTVSSLERVDCHDVHACVRFQLMDVVFPAADNCVYYCHARGVGRDAPDHLSLMVYHAPLTGSEKAKVVFGSIVQLPFDMYYADAKDRAVGEHEYFGCEAVIQKLFLARSGSTVCLLKIYLSKHASSSTDSAVDSAVPVAATSTKKPKNEREFEDQAVFLLVSLQDNTACSGRTGY